MANEHHLIILYQGVATWNQWRLDNPLVQPDLRSISFRTTSPSMLGIDLNGVNFRDTDLSEADFYRACLVQADFSGAKLPFAIFGEATLGGAKFIGADLQDANFMKAHLYEVDFTDAKLDRAKLYGAFLEQAKLEDVNLAGQWLQAANLKDANLQRTDLHGANLQNANLHGADLSEAILTGADLQGAQLIETKIEGANLDHALVRGVSVWDLQGKPRSQSGLVISSGNEGQVTVDDLEVAQFIHLLLNNEKIRNVIDTMGKKAVLILGRFTPKRKAVLDAIREELRKRGWLPVLFDFEGPASRDLTETVSTLAHMARFIIADITQAKSIAQELQAIVPNLPSVPVQPLLQSRASEYGMFERFKRFPWVLPIYRYHNQVALITALGEHIIAPAERKAQEMAPR